MKRIITLAVIALLALPVAAQQQTRQDEGPAKEQKGGWNEKFEMEKIAFITKYVGLTEAEAQAFWPVYNKAEAEVKELVHAEREAFKALNKGLADNLPEAEIKALSKAYAEAASKKIDKSKYLDKYLEVLPAEKAAKVLLSEERFRRQQILRLRDGKPQGRPNHSPHRPRPEK